MTFQIWTKTMQDGEWTIYGVFTSQQEFRNELPNIRAQGLYFKRVSI